MKKMIHVGYTNPVKYVENGKFVLEKTYTGFNHFIDYHKLEVLPFVPELFADDENHSEWEYIDGKMVTAPSSSDLVLIATQLHTLHNSSIKFPKNNIRRRVHAYLKLIHAKGMQPPLIEECYKEMQKTLSNMNMKSPVHNDVWHENLLKTPQGKIFFVDWEYSTMGDPHFDLAFFIESSRLNEEQEKVFLDAYSGGSDDAYYPYILTKYKRLCHYLTICWAHAQEKMPFDISWMEEFLIKTKPN